MMIKKISELNPKEKKIINNAIFLMLIGLILLLSFKGYHIYQDYGFKYCIEEKDDITNFKEVICFNTSKERIDYLINMSEPWTNNLDYNYINRFNNTLDID